MLGVIITAIHIQVLPQDQATANLGYIGKTATCVWEVGNAGRVMAHIRILIH